MNPLNERDGRATGGVWMWTSWGLWIFQCRCIPYDPYNPYFQQSRRGERHPGPSLGVPGGGTNSGAAGVGRAADAERQLAGGDAVGGGGGPVGQAGDVADLDDQAVVAGGQPGRHVEVAVEEAVQ